jgi:hypothetical protein
MTTVASVVAVVVGVAMGAALVAGCGLEPANGYLQSPDGSLSLRHPREWTEVEVVPLGLEWLAAVDGASTPSGEHQRDFVQDAPFLLAQVVPLNSEFRADASLAQLRTFALPDQRDPAAEPDGVRVLFHDEIVDERGFEGHHIRFEVRSESGTAIAEHLAVYDPGRTRIQRIRVACSVACFEANTAAIEDVFASVRFRE